MKKTIILWLGIFACMISTSVYAAIPIVWQKDLNHTATNRINGLKLTPNNDNLIVFHYTGDNNWGTTIPGRFDKLDAQTGNPVWIPTKEVSKASEKIALSGWVDNNGNIYFGCSWDGYTLWKYNPTLSSQLGSYTGGTGFEYVYNIITDDSGNIYAAGHIGSWSGAPSAVVKLNSSGGLIWSSTIGSYTGSKDIFTYGLALDSSGNVFHVGHDYHPGFPACHGRIIGHLASNGTVFFNKLVDELNSGACGVIADAADKIYVGYSYNLWKPDQTYTLAERSAILKLNQNGSVAWKYTFDDVGMYLPWGCIVKHTDNSFYVAFNLHKNGTVYPGIAEIDSGGNLLWKDTIDKPGWEIAQSSFAAAGDHLYLGLNNPNDGTKTQVLSLASLGGGTGLVAYADFGSSTIQTSNMNISPGSSFVWNSYYNVWRIENSGGGFTGSFTAPTAGSYKLVVTHLSSADAGCQGGGYSPVIIKVNGSTIASDYDPASNHSGTHGWVTDTWTVSANAGSNSIQWIAGALCTHYWIQRIEVVSQSTSNGGLIAHWSFDNPSDPGHDDSGNGHNGTNYGATGVSGKCGNALSFNGTSNYVEVPDSDALDPTTTQEITIAAWIKVDNYLKPGNQTSTILAKLGYGYDLGDYTFCIQNQYIPALEGRLTFGVLSPSPVNWQDVYSNSKVPLNRWVHVAATHDKAQNTKLYIDGVLEGSNPSSMFISQNFINNPDPVSIGWQMMYPGYFDGVIDNVRLYNRALSASEIQGLYNNCSEQMTASLSGVIFNDTNANQKFDNGEAISGATVFCDSKSVLSDSAGKYALTGLPLGPTTVEVRINNKLYAARPYNLKVGPNICDLPVYISTIDSAIVCPPPEASCAVSFVGLLPYAGTPADIVSISLAMCAIDKRSEAGDPIGAIVAALKAVDSVRHVLTEWGTAGTANLVDIIVKSVKCAEGFLWEWLEDKCGGYTKCLWAALKGLSSTIVEGALTPLLVVFTGSPVDIHIYDLQGNVLERGNGELPTSGLSSPGWVTRSPNDKELAIVFDANGTYIVEITGRPEAGAGSTFHLEILRQFANGTQRLLTYSNVPIAAGGIARAIASEQIAPLLEVDIDGDGSVDVNVMPDPPVANASADQTVYAWIDGKAKVTLNGSDSNDPDGDMLTYKWTWAGGSVTGVNPTIELPIGAHTISLVVNDGLVDSAADDVNITVVAPVQGTLKITPRTINRKSNQPSIKVSIELPDTIAKADVDLGEMPALYPSGINAISQKILPIGDGSQKFKIEAVFDKAALMDAVAANGDIELKVAGKLKSGQYFYGADVVRTIR